MRQAYAPASRTLHSGRRMCTTAPVRRPVENSCTATAAGVEQRIMNAEQSWPESAGMPDGPEPPRPEAEGLRIVRWLGSGAAASVWLALAEDGTEYALKVFAPA